MDWKDFLGIHENVYPNLVKIFYANLSTKHNTLFVVLVELIFTCHVMNLRIFSIFLAKELTCLVNLFSCLNNILNAILENLPQRIHNDPNPTSISNENIFFLYTSMPSDCRNHYAQYFSQIERTWSCQWMHITSHLLHFAISTCKTSKINFWCHNFSQYYLKESAL